MLQPIATHIVSTTGTVGLTRIDRLLHLDILQWSKIAHFSCTWWVSLRAMGWSWEPVFMPNYGPVPSLSHFRALHIDIWRVGHFDMVMDQHVVNVPCKCYISTTKPLFDLILESTLGPNIVWALLRPSKPSPSSWTFSLNVSGTLPYKLIFVIMPCITNVFWDLWLVLKVVDLMILFILYI